VCSRLLEADCLKRRVKMPTKDIGLAQRRPISGAEEQPRLAVSDELNQQLRHILRKVNFALPVFGLEVVVNFAVPRLLVNDDPAAAVQNLVQADAECFAKPKTSSAAQDEKHSHLRFDGRRVGKVIHHVLGEARSTLLPLIHLRDN
jgi:hypothetical protein